eukprot:15436550-Alexandrium_andersonii.AAC.1
MAASEQPTRLAPATLGGLLQWPYTVLASLQGAAGTVLDPRAFKRLVGHIRGGIQVTTSYSGVGAPELAMRFLEEAFAKFQVVEPSTDDAPAFFFRHACDNKREAQEILCHGGVGAPAHVFIDIISKLPENIEPVFRNLQAPFGSTLEEK